MMISCRIARTTVALAMPFSFAPDLAAQVLCSKMESGKLIAAANARTVQYGFSVGIDGDAAIVGALDFQDPVFGLIGTAYICRHDGSSWAQEQQLVPSDGVAGDKFGYSVGVSENVAIVGSPYHDARGRDAGAAYVFRHDGTQWVETIKLLGSEIVASDNFGLATAVSGSTAVVGAFRDDLISGGEAGSVYVFRFDGSAWIEQQKLVASDGAAGDGFGNSVAIDGDALVVGAYGDDFGGTHAGAAYVFRYNGSFWVEEQKLLPSDRRAGDLVGRSVAISGNRVIVGADGHDHSADQQLSAAYIFAFNGSSWTEQAELVSPDGIVFDAFGHSVGICGDTAIVGASRFDDLSQGVVDVGAAYLFRYDDSSWRVVRRFVASDAEADDNLGWCIAIGEHTVIAGAKFDEHPNHGSGSAYIFDVPAAASTCPCETTCDSPASVDVFDLLEYLALWFALDAAAELTGEDPARIDVFDLLHYLDCWFGATEC